MLDNEKGSRTIVAEEPWYAFPPAPGQDWRDLQWGFLVQYSSGEFFFDDSRQPTDEQILARKGCPLDLANMERTESGADG